MSARIMLCAVVLAALGGCATFSPDGGFGTVEKAVMARTGKDLAWVKAPEQRDNVEKRVAELLARPISADDAVQVALLNNRGLQAEFAELNIGEADLVQAGRLPNPRFAMMHASRPENGGREYKIEQACVHSMLADTALEIVCASSTSDTRAATNERQSAAELALLKVAAAR